MNCLKPAQEFGIENSSREVAFQAAITAVNQAASEQELDERVGSALSSLDGSVLLLPLCSSSCWCVAVGTTAAFCLKDCSYVRFMLCGAECVALASQTGLPTCITCCVLQCVQHLLSMAGWRMCTSSQRLLHGAHNAWPPCSRTLHLLESSAKLGS